MSMRTCLTMFVVVVSAGCPWPPRADGSTLALQRSCPDPPNCTVGNGTGVYTEEQGTAAIGPSKLLITHFFNVTGGGVRFMGRYRFTPSVGSPTWQMLSEPGQVRQATYAGLAGLDVLSVREQGTQPTWVLRSPAGGPIEVTGDQLRGLSLEISFATPNDGQRSYELDFAGALSPHVADLSAQATLRPVALAMRWRVPGGAPEDYCFRAPAGGAATPDAVVFLGGIDVDPVTGSLTPKPASGTPVPESTMVTLSCFLGAPATVFRWGYRHDVPDRFYFAAGIQMKRAAYCADELAFTLANTPIAIADDAVPAIHRAQPTAVEAWWTPTGATCVNLDARRHPELGFNGVCPGKAALPACPPPAALQHPMLLDGR